MKNTTESVLLSIEGMSCGHCVQAVNKALSAVPGVTLQSVVVGAARVQLADGATPADALAAVERAGFTARIAEDQPLAGSD